MAGWSLSTDQLAHNYFPFLKAYLRHFERVRLSELHFPLPLYNLPELPASSTDRGTGLSGPTLQRLWDSITGGGGGTILLIKSMLRHCLQEHPLQCPLSSSPV